MTVYTFSYYKDSDFGRVRQLIIDSKPHTGPIVQAWGLERINFSCFPQHIHQTDGTWRRTAGLWSDENGRLVAMAMDEGENRGEAFLHFLEPHQPIPSALLQDMLFFVETHLRTGEKDGKQQLFMYIPEALTELKDFVTARGYQNTGRLERTMVLPLCGTPLEVQLPAGFTIRSGEDVSDAERALCHQHGFGYGWPYCQYTEQCFTLMRQAPDYLPELDLTVFDTAGRPAAYAHFWYDAQNEFSMLEPLATVKWHRRKGLGRALIHEGANRLMRMGKCSGMLGGDQPFYTALGFVCAGSNEVWSKELPKNSR